MTIKKEKATKPQPNSSEKEGEALIRNASHEIPDKAAEETTPQEEPVKMVILPAEDVNRLKQEVEQAIQSANENLENWKRERADFLNYKKLLERDQLQLNERIRGDIIKKYLPVLDDMERALKTLPNQGAQGAWTEGIDLIYRKLQNIIESEGVTKITATAFDPTRHEAITYEPNPEHQSGEVIEIVQQGYMLGDRVLRPALVRVAQ